MDNKVGQEPSLFSLHRTVSPSCRHYFCPNCSRLPLSCHYFFGPLPRSIIDKKCFRLLKYIFYLFFPQPHYELRPGDPLEDPPDGRVEFSGLQISAINFLHNPRIKWTQSWTSRGQLLLKASTNSLFSVQYFVGMYVCLYTFTNMYLLLVCWNVICILLMLVWCCGTVWGRLQ